MLSKKPKEDEPVNSTDLLLEKLDKLESEGQVPVEKSKQQLNLNILAKKLQGLVIQKYIENPLLINGKKFDIRCFMLIVSTKPFLVLTNPGYVRVSLEDYCSDTKLETKEQRARHLTNASI